MTSDEIQELRDWSALKMGWEQKMTTLQDRLGSPALWWHNGKKFCFPVIISEECTDCGNPYYAPWQPDKDANQCFMLVEKMRQLGWYLYFEPEPNLTFPGFEKGIIIYEIGFYHPENQKARITPHKGYCMSQKITCLAIIKAAMATGS